MPTRRVLTWIIFGLCALAVVEGLGWVTWQAVRLERLERQARADARMQEDVTVALWRMDSELTPIIAEESRRPYYEYRSFYYPDRAYTRMWQELQAGEIRVKSDLLESPGPFIRLHFQVEPDGSITSPQAPTGNMRDLAESQYVDGEFIVYATGLLDELTTMVRAGSEAGQLLARAALDAPAEPASGTQLGDGERANAAGESAREQQQLAAAPELLKSEMEFKNRQQVAQQASEYGQRSRTKTAVPQREESIRGMDDKAVGDARDENQKRFAEANEPAPEAATAGFPGTKEDERRVGAASTDRVSPIVPSQPAPPQHAGVEHMGFEPGWLSNPRTGEPELVFRRVVRIDEQQITQGFWLDWPAIRVRLTERVRDLLPQARVEPVLAGEADLPRSRMVASIPAVLVIGDLPTLVPLGFTATHATLAVTWLAVVGAIAAIGVVLRKSMALSDRRGRFVSAVTHELRTPLTTFCLYTEMLADGMVKDDGARRTYLDTLKGESRRLARIVENVLDYARLGQGRAHTNGQIAPIPVGQVLGKVRPVLERRAEQDRMSLVWDAPPAVDAEAARCNADPQSIERILYNLVDNACKYAAEAADRRVHVTTRIVSSGRRQGADALEVVVRDHGPGIPASEHRRIFQSFHRSRRDEQGPKSGLGLGLALSRGLARELGGDLELLNDAEPGAALRLTLPVSCAPVSVKE